MPSMMVLEVARRSMHSARERAYTWLHLFSSLVSHASSLEVCELCEASWRCHGQGASALFNPRAWVIVRTDSRTPAHAHPCARPCRSAGSTW